MSVDKLHYQQCLYSYMYMKFNYIWYYILRFTNVLEQIYNIKVWHQDKQGSTLTLVRLSGTSEKNSRTS